MRVRDGIPPGKTALSRQQVPDTEWVELAWNRHAAQVWAYAARRVGPEAAGDVVSAVFLIAWRRRDDRPRKPLPWLFGISRHVVYEEWRRRSRAEALFERAVQDLNTDVCGQSESEVVDRASAVAALAALEEEDREALLLTAWEGLSGADAARAMGVAHAAFRVRKLRARRRLESAFTELERAQNHLYWEDQ